MKKSDFFRLPLGRTTVAGTQTLEPRNNFSAHDGLGPDDTILGCHLHPGESVSQKNSARLKAFLGCDDPRTSLGDFYCVEFELASLVETEQRTATRGLACLSAPVEALVPGLLGCLVLD